MVGVNLSCLIDGMGVCVSGGGGGEGGKRADGAGGGGVSKAKAAPVRGGVMGRHNRT